MRSKVRISFFATESWFIKSSLCVQIMFSFFQPNLGLTIPRYVLDSKAFIFRY